VIIWEKEAFMDTSRKTINVVAALIRDGKRVFATARGYGNYKGWWEFPGGKVELGESPEYALVREIREELDSEISVDEYISTIEHDYPEFHLSMRCYWCSLISGDLVLKEAEDAKWLDVDTIDSVKWLPADITLIDEIKKRMA
jgi:8-oxo-dGTP diphosphatase